MKETRLLLPLLAALIAIVFLPTAQALSANSFSPSKTSYNPGDSGTVALSIFNDRNSTIRIDAVSLIFNYFYQSGVAYSQNFGVTGLSQNVTSNTSSQSITISFTLPSDVAPGYFVPVIQVTYNVLQAGVWTPSRTSNFDATSPLYVESAYKGQYQTTVTTEYVFIAIMALFGVMSGYFALRYYSAKASAQPSQRS